jgi:hypothetical protein
MSAPIAQNTTRLKVESRLNKEKNIVIMCEQPTSRESLNGTKRYYKRWKEVVTSTSAKDGESETQGNKTRNRKRLEVPPWKILHS